MLKTAAEILAEGRREDTAGVGSRGGAGILTGVLTFVVDVGGVGEEVVEEEIEEKEEEEEEEEEINEEGVTGVLGAGAGTVAAAVGVGLEVVGVV
jgi:hypothetical protein